MDRRENKTIDNINNPTQAAIDLAHFINDLQKIDSTNGPLADVHGLRGVSLSTRDTETREAISALSGLIETEAVIREWEVALQSPEWNSLPVWFHGDMLPGNILFNEAA